ncbi:hypothetical protein [Hydrogenophaga sp.]|uniref:hypothetical protein n=1 Tax=Hydrogenophaga sp. TaxID=1904254 RepID=UPI002715FB30|nr:hypothetical protein [Hydrogenophaga sp.]MDO9437191.1 hypothetical protein [Hydrogenophaga sp.]
MKRTAPDTSRPSLLVGTSNPPDPQTGALAVPAGRQPDGEGLVSLAVFADGHSLQAALAWAVKRNPGKAVVQEAADLIALLDITDEVPVANEDVLQTAVQILLNYNQGALLCRLAEKRPGHLFYLDIGDDLTHAEMVADIGAKWPEKSWVSVELSTALPAASVNALLPFLQRPDKTGIRVAASTTQEAIADFVSALIEIIPKSKVRQLHIGTCAMDGKTSARLLACRRDWQSFMVCFSPEVSALLGQGQHRIGWLELYMADETPQAALAFMQHMSSPQCLQLLHCSGAYQLVVHGPVDLVAWVEEMDRYTTRHSIGKLLEFFQASFLTAQGADAEAALASLERNGRVVGMSCLPLSNAVSGYVPLSATQVSRLSNPSTTTIMALQQQAHAVGAQAQAALAQARVDTILALTRLLGNQFTLQSLFDYLVSPENTLIKSRTYKLEPTILANTSPGFKLQILGDAEFDITLLQVALTARLRAFPPEIEPTLDALIQVQSLTARLMQPRSLDEWRALGRRYQSDWGLGGGGEVDGSEFEDVTPRQNPGVAEPRMVPLPPAVADRWALIEPGTQAGFAAFVQTLNARIQVLDAAVMAGTHGPDAVARREAAFLIRHFLMPAAAPRTLRVLNAQMAEFMAKELLRAGQGKLLRHLLPAGLKWFLHVREDVAAALKQVAPWPVSQSECFLTVHPDLSDEALEQVVQFAAGVPAKQLTLQIELGRAAVARHCDALVRIVASKPGLRLSLGWSFAKPIVSESWMPFFVRLQKLPVGRIHLAQMENPDPQLLPALLDVIRGSGVRTLALISCSEALARGVLTCQAWDSLEVRTSETLADVFKEKMVSAKVLVLQLAATEHQQHAEDIIATCKDLERVEVDGYPINIAVLARGLERSHAVLSARCTPAQPSAQDRQMAVASFRRNPWIIDIQLEPLQLNGRLQRVPFLAGLQRQVKAVVDVNRLRYSPLFRTGAGRGVGMSPGAALPMDVWAHIGGFLDLKSARSLSLTNRAAYAASQEAWRMEIHRLADLFAPHVAYGTFSLAVARRIVAWKLGGVPPTRDTKTTIVFMDLVQQKIWGLRKAGVDDSVIVLALGRRLARVLPRTDPSNVSNTSNVWNLSQTRETGEADEREAAHIYDLLKGLASMGAIPAEVWLLEGMGVDVRSGAVGAWNPFGNAVTKDEHTHTGVLL